MASFSSNETDAITKTVELLGEITKTPINSLSEVYELNKIIKWAKEKNLLKTVQLWSGRNFLFHLRYLPEHRGFMYTERALHPVTVSNKQHIIQVCLQFPDSLLCDSAEVCLYLERQLNQKFYILGDTSYGSCCVDEVAAQHVNADGIIHFGHACLSPCTRLPVLYIFHKKHMDVNHFLECFNNVFPDNSIKILLLYDVSYAHYIDKINHSLSSKYKNIVVSKLCEDNIQDCKVRLGRTYNLDGDESSYTVVYIGYDGRTLTNFVISMSYSAFYIYDPDLKDVTLKHYEVGKSKFMMKRYYMVEKVKDANTLGIIVGTLGVSSYLEAIDRIKLLAQKQRKKSYIFAVGKPNVPKLANFPEIDVFVLIACPENSLFDSKEFYKPVVTPYEVEVACQLECLWSENYVNDFRELLPGGSKHSEITDDDNYSVDVSLITGCLRRMRELEVENSYDCTDVAIKNDLTVSTPFSSGSNFLTSRSWKGLEQNIGETEVKLAEEGRSGIPQNYVSEVDILKNT